MSIGGSDLDKYIIPKVMLKEWRIDILQGHPTAPRMSSDTRKPGPRAMLQGTRAVDRRRQRRGSRCASDGMDNKLIRLGRS